MTLANILAIIISTILALIIGVYIGRFFGIKPKNRTIDSLELANRVTGKIFEFRILILIYKTINRLDYPEYRIGNRRAYNDLMTLWLLVKRQAYLQKNEDILPYLFKPTYSQPNLEAILTFLFKSNNGFAFQVEEILEKLNYNDLHDFLWGIQKVYNLGDLEILYKDYYHELNSSTGAIDLSQEFLPSRHFERLHGDSTIGAPPPDVKKKKGKGK